MGNAFDLTEIRKKIRLRSTKMGFKQDPGKTQVGDEYFFWSWQSANDWRNRLPPTREGIISKDRNRNQWKVEINFVIM